MALTQNQIIALIDEIQPAADYPATKMNPLLTKILAAAYGPMYIGALPPSNTTDENAGYRPGSVGYDTVTKRYYICQSALAGNAVWILIPADSNYLVAAYTTTAQQVVCSVNTTVVKCSNDSVGGNLGCSLKLPANPYIGRTVLVYFDDSIITFTVRDSSGTAVNDAISLTIPAGQQYTFTYSGTAWELVGVSNIAPASVSGVDVANTGGVVTNDTNKLTFLGTGATVAAIVEQILALIDDAVEPLSNQHAQEVVDTEKTLALMGVKRGGKKMLEDRHKREIRRYRTDELRSGLTAIASIYRDELTRNPNIHRPEAYITAINRLHEGMRRLSLNVNEAILLRDLIWSLPSPSADAALQFVLSEHAE